MTVSQNINPYYNDFDEDKHFHQIMFKPGFAVQARELTQLQSILRSQIEKFGNHIFKQGSIVIPGNSFAEEKTPFVKVDPTFNSVAVIASDFEGLMVVGLSSGVRAYVKKAIAATDTDPLTLYLAYASGGVDSLGVPNGKLVFDDEETIRLETNFTKNANTIAVGSTGFGSMAFVNKGVYYVNGTFVTVEKQAVVTSKYTTTPSCHVLLKVTESIVDFIADESLLDPAQGTSNFAAPGADRLKIELTLTTLPLGSAIADDYIELMRYENGVMVEHSNMPKYNELEKSLAQRTYDESGDYVVNGFDINLREHKRDLLNGGLYLDGDYGKFVYELSAGKAYIQGLAVENIASKSFVADKARTAPHIAQSKKTIKPVWGQYLMVSDPIGTLNIQARETIQLWDISASTGGTQVGTARVVGLDYLVGDGSSHPIYKLYISDLNITTGSYDSIGSVRLASGNFTSKVVAEYSAPITSGSFAAGDVVTFNTTTRVATVSFYDTAAGKLYAYKHAVTDTPKSGDSIVGPTATSVVKSKKLVMSSGSSGLIFALPGNATKALRDSFNNFDLTYTSWDVLTIAAGSTTTSTSSGTIVPIEAGTFVALSNSGPDANSAYSLNTTGTVITRSSVAPAGGITIYCQVTRTNATPRTKSIATHSGTYSSTAIVQLSHADVYQIDSIVSGGIDIASKYDLDTGQTDYEYGIASIKLKNGFSVPAGSVIVTYKYFSHTVGDFFSVDSYPVSLDSDLIPVYQSPADGRTFELRDVVDFRKTVGINSNAIVPDTFITTSVQNYVPRIDVMCINRQGAIQMVSGIPSIVPKSPVIPSALYALEAFYVSAYTYRLEDIKSRRMATTRYTMSDVGALDKRLGNLEEYSTLTAAEAKVTNTPFIDAATGLDRFKTGYLVESMEDPFKVANAFSDEFSASINSKYGITAKHEEDVVKLSLAATGGYAVNASTALITATSTAYTTSTYFNTNGVITLPYYDTKFVSVGVSSRLTNINPFNIIGWSGSLTLIPPSDIWFDVINKPDIVVNRTIFASQWVPPPIASTPIPAPVSTPVDQVTSGNLAVVVTQNITPLYANSPFVIGPVNAAGTSSPSDIVNWSNVDEIPSSSTAWVGPDVYGN